MLPPLWALGATRILDVALEHSVFEALLVQDRLGDIVERYDALQRRALHHRNVSRMLLEHRTPQLHHVEMRGGRQRIALADVGNAQVAERAATFRHRLQHFSEREQSRHPAAIHDDERTDVVLRHHRHCVENGTVRRGREKRMTFDAQNLVDQHGRLLVFLSARDRVEVTPGPRAEATTHEERRRRRWPPITYKAYVAATVRCRGTRTTGSTQ